MKPDEFISFARLSLSGSQSDIRLYLAKLVRKMKKTEPEFATQLEALLKSEPTRANGIMRKATPPSTDFFSSSTENELSLLKSFETIEAEEPLLDNSLANTLKQVITERDYIEELTKKGLKPASSLIFKGPPGVGKTMTAHWLASKLNLPFYVLDLTAVMSSYLGKTGSNLRSVIEFAKSHPCVLLLDEIDAIAKKRSDEADVGELKRLVTVMLQELENWPSKGLLIAATNHPELVDPALWRRFDIEVSFSNPSDSNVCKAVTQFLSDDVEEFLPWLEFLIDSQKGYSYSHIKRSVLKLRKMKLINPKAFEENIFDYLLPDMESLSRPERISVAVRLVSQFNYPKQKAAKVTGVSRDTIRKRLSEVNN